MLAVQGMLVALETPHSPKGLHLLARHSQSFASALLHFIPSVTTPITKADNAAAAAAFAFTPRSQHAPMVAQTDSSSLRLEQAVHKPGHQSLHESLKAMRDTQPVDIHQDQLAVCQDPSNDSFCAGALREVAQQHRHQKGPVAGSGVKASSAAGVAAAVATAHRCLESMLARDNVFALPPSVIVQTLSSPALVFTSAIGIAPLNPISEVHATPTAMTPVHGSQCEAGLASGCSWAGAHSVQGGVQVGGVQWGLRKGAGVYMGCCSLVMAGLRHHAAAVRRSMALVGASTRALLKALMLWSQSSTRWLPALPPLLLSSVLLFPLSLLFVRSDCLGRQAKPCGQLFVKLLYPLGTAAHTNFSMFPKTHFKQCLSMSLTKYLRTLQHEAAIVIALLPPLGFCVPLSVLQGGYNVQQTQCCDKAF